MKVGVIGVGRVGAACALSLVVRGSAREVVLVDRTRARAKAVATDLRYGAPLCPEVVIRDGDYADLAGADLVMLTAGVNEKSGGATDRNDREGRLKLLDTNVSVFKDMVPKIVTAAPAAVLLVVTDPPDPLADLVRRLAGHDRVLSTGNVDRQPSASRSCRRTPRGQPCFGRGPSHRRARHFRGDAVVVGQSERRADRRGLAGREFVRRLPQKRRARCPLRQHHDHRRERGEPVRDRDRVRADRRSGVARRAGGVADRHLQHQIRCNLVVAERRRAGRRQSHSRTSDVRRGAASLVPQH